MKHLPRLDFPLGTMRQSDVDSRGWNIQGRKRQRIEASPYFPRSSICQNGKAAGFANKIGQLQKLVSGTEALFSNVKVACFSSNLIGESYTIPDPLPTALTHLSGQATGGTQGRGGSLPFASQCALTPTYPRKEKRSNGKEGAPQYLPYFLVFSPPPYELYVCIQKGGEMGA